MVYVIAIIVGFCVGSFANVVIDRVPRGISLRGRSSCDHCRRTLHTWELIPVVSALMFRFRCPTCAYAIPLRYALIELAGAALALLAMWSEPNVPHVLLVFAGLAVIGILACIDFDLGVVPDAITIPAIVTLGILGILVLPGHWYSVPFAMVAGAAWFALQHLFSRGRWVGDGDIRVGALMGAFLGPGGLAVAFVTSYIIGGVVAGALLVMRRARRGDHLPFVPFLFVGALVAALWGNRILEFYAMR